MTNANLTTASKPSTPYVTRVLENDALKKGVAAAAAGVLIAAIAEAIWPSES